VPTSATRAQEDDGATLDVVEVRSDTFPRIVVCGHECLCAGTSIRRGRYDYADHVSGPSMEVGKPQTVGGVVSELRGRFGPGTR
jgi:hypothetical protein